MSILVVLARLYPPLTDIDTLYLGGSEEVLKFGIIALLIYLVQLKPKSIPFIGVGFGFAEAIAYLDSVGYTEIDSLWMHIAVGLIMAFFFRLALKTKTSFSRGLYYGLAFIIPMYSHIFYNLFLFDVFNTVYFF